jgi:hypothetical protein
MDFIFIYGPPGVGKLTVAKALSRITKYPVFHNNATIDAVIGIFPYGTKQFIDIVDRFRISVITEAAKSNINKGLIFTMVYAKGDDDDWIKGVKMIIDVNNGRFLPVRLYCNHSRLVKRVEGESRKQFNKIHDRKKLESLLKSYDMISSIPFMKSLEIDNTHLSPRKTAELIKSHYGL